jgi:hypothetical protein
MLLLLFIIFLKKYNDHRVDIIILYIYLKP